MEKLNVEDRRDFLKKSVYAAPALVALGALNVYADSSNGNSKAPTNSKGVVIKTNSSLKCNTGSSGSSSAPTQSSSTGNSIFGNDNSNNNGNGNDNSNGNNGFGNGDQNAPGNSLNNNNAENSQGSNNGQSKKNGGEE